MVDEAKAFCPGCGHAFVEEEKRQKASEFDKEDSTVQLGQTMFNQMLSDMGLNIGARQAPEKRIEMIAPVGEKTVSAAPAILKPVETKPAPVAVESNTDIKKPGRAKWVVLGVIGFIILFPPALASSVILVLQIWERYR